MTTFSTEAEALALEPPPHDGEQRHRVVFHSHDRCFGVRLSRAEADGSCMRVWIARYRGADGKDQKPTLGQARRGSMDGARIEALSLKDKARDKRRAGVGECPSFGEALAQYRVRRQKKWSADTIANYDKLTPLLKPLMHKKSDRVTTDECNGLYFTIIAGVRKRNADRPDRKGEATAKGALRLARAVFSSLQRRNVISFNPCGELTDDLMLDEAGPRRSRAIPRDRLPEVWPWLMTRAPGAVRDYILCGLIFAYRESLLNNLCWDQVDAKRRVLHVPEGARGNKAKEPFDIPIPDWLWENVFAVRLADPNRDRKWVLPSIRHPGKPVRSIRGALRSLERYTRQGPGLPGVKVSEHDLRRSCASLFDAVVGNPLLRKRLLMHSNEASDERNRTSSDYVIFDDTVMREAMNRVMEHLLYLCDRKEHARWMLRHVPDQPAVTGPVARPQPLLDSDDPWADLRDIMPPMDNIESENAHARRKHQRLPHPPVHREGRVIRKAAALVADSSVDE